MINSASKQKAKCLAYRTENERDLMTTPPTNIKIFLQTLLIAGCSASSAEFLTFPIDTTKIYLQLNKTTTINNGNIGYLQRKQSKRISSLNNRYLSNYHYTVCQIYDKGGMKGFYRGYKPALLRASLNNALSATFYKRIRANVFGHNTRDCPYYVKCCSGFLTGGITQILAAPTDLLKVRLQADSTRPIPRYDGLLDAAHKIYKQHGFCAFYRGLWPSIGRAGFSVAATFATYDHCKSYILRKMAWQDNTKTHIGSSLFSGLAATLVSCPFDVVKTRYQSQSISSPLYKSSYHCLSTITKEEGISVLYRGFGPMYFRLAPWQLTFFIGFEFLSKYVVGESF